MRGTTEFPDSGATARTTPSGTAAEIAAADARAGWFVLHAAVASAVAAALSYQLTVLVVTGGAIDAWSSVTFAALVVGLTAGGWTALVALPTWLLLNAQAARRERWHAAHPVVPGDARHVEAARGPGAAPRARALRWRGFSVLHIVAIGTAVPWIVLSLLLGSWQATTITIVVAVVAGAAGGFAGARRVWRPNRRAALSGQGAPRLGPALEHLPAEPTLQSRGSSPAGAAGRIKGVRSSDR